MYKYTLLLTMILFISSCKSNKDITTNSNQQSTCPANGTCSFEVLKNKELLILEDEFKNTYHELKPADGKVVLKFEYKRTTKPEISDDHYSEIVFIEIDENLKDLNLTDQLLSNAKVSYNRLCFCRGATGIYKVKKGNLKISKENKKYKLTLDFTVNEVPQIINSFEQYFEL